VNELAENEFVDELMRITEPMLRKMTVLQREQALVRLNNYLDSLVTKGRK